MYGKNPKRPPVKGEGEMLDIQDIFATFQGEGPYVGWPAIFIRLGGCNLACNFCDTEFETYKSFLLQDIIDKVTTLTNKHRLIVITGGEPLRQPIKPLCESLIELGYQIQIESNGTLYRPLPAEVEIVCSPKNIGQGYTQLRKDLVPHLSAIKFIVSATDPLYQDIKEIAPNNIPVYIQPMDEYDHAKNLANKKHAVELAKKYGVRVSVQMHKVLGVE